MNNPILPILQVDNVLLSPDILTERFCCDYEKCKGICCIEGTDGAPVTLEEIGKIEESIDEVWNEISASAQAVIDRQGVSYVDREGDLVTSIVNGKDCVFTCQKEGKCLCLLEKAYREGRTTWKKPISCSLYPIREKRFANGTVGLNYHRWEVCRDAVVKGKAEDLPLYKFLREPLIERFGEEWYAQLEQLAAELTKNGYL